MQCNLGFGWPHIWMPVSRRKCRSSRLTSFDLPLLLWQLALPTCGVCLTGRPANPAMFHSSLLRVLVGNPAYLQCPSRSWESLRNVLILALRWAGGPHHLSPVVFWPIALGVLCRASHLEVSPPQGHKRSHVCLVYASSETSHIYPETYSNGGCCCSCGGIGVGHSLLPGSVFQ